MQPSGKNRQIGTLAGSISRVVPNIGVFGDFKANDSANQSAAG
jgi:hypothetical protein